MITSSMIGNCGPPSHSQQPGSSALIQAYSASVGAGFDTVGGPTSTRYTVCWTTATRNAGSADAFLALAIALHLCSAAMLTQALLAACTWHIILISHCVCICIYVYMYIYIYIYASSCTVSALVSLWHLAGIFCCPLHFLSQRHTESQTGRLEEQSADFSASATILIWCSMEVQKARCKGPSL